MKRGIARGATTLAPEMGSGLFGLLLVKSCIATEGLFYIVHMRASTVVASFNALHAAQRNLSACFATGHPGISVIAVDIDPAGSVAPGARHAIGA